MTLKCKHCESEYHGDDSAVRLCDPCFEDFTAQGWDIDEMFEKFPPDDESAGET